MVLVRARFQKKTSGVTQLQKYMSQYAHAYCLVALAKTTRPLEVLPAVPRGEHLAHVEVRQHEARDQDQLGHGVQVLVRDVRRTS